MNRKEIGELRRRWAPEKNCVSKIYARYLNREGQTVTEQEISCALMTETDAEKYFSLLKKTFSGQPDRNLLPLSFTNAQVADSDEHRLLTALRTSGCEDKEARDALCARIAESYRPEGNYLILFASDTYDVPFRKGDTIRQESEVIFRYFVVCVCPVPDGKAALAYDAEQKEFRVCPPVQTVGTPEFGFVFPAFDNRRANIYSTTFYSRDPKEDHGAVISSLFKTEAPMSAGEQRETFSQVLTEALEKDCSFDLLRDVNEQIRDRLDEYKESGDEEPLDFSARDVADILRDNGIGSEKIAVFEEKCAEAFGNDAPLTPVNIVDVRKFEVKTPSVRITVSPEAVETIETRKIGDRHYLLIPADGGVEINGVGVHVGVQDDDIENEKAGGTEE